MGIHLMPPLYKVVMPRIYTGTFYPNVHPEVTSVDGMVRHATVNQTWPALVGSPGSNAVDNAAWESVCLIGAGGVLNTWYALERGIFLFDTSSIPPGAEIIAATLSLFGRNKTDALVIAPNVNIYSSNPASNVALVAGDFDSLGGVPFCDTPITYAGWSIVGYNDFVLNAAGRNAIAKGGITKLGTRNANYDVAIVAPAWSLAISAIYAYNSEGGVGWKPKLTVTWGI